MFEVRIRSPFFSVWKFGHDGVGRLDVEGVGFIGVMLYSGCQLFLLLLYAFYFGNHRTLSKPLGC